MKTLLYSRIIFLFAVLSAGSVFAQKQGQQRIDSLIDRVATARPDTNKALLLSKISFLYSSINPTEGLKYGKRAMDLARNLEWIAGMGNAYNAIGTNYQVMSDYGKARENFSKSMGMYKAIDDELGIAIVTGNMGVTYDNLGNYSKAFEHHNEALALYRKVKDTIGEARCLCNIGVVYSDVEEYDQAIHYYTKALRICKQINYKKDIATNTHNIGFAYRKLGQYDKAIEYSSKALRMNEALNENEGKAICYDNIGSAYLAKKNYAKAMRHYELGLAITRQINSRRREAAILGKIGTCYLAQAKDNKVAQNNDHVTVTSDDYLSAEGVENLNKAIKYLNESIVLCRKLGIIDYLKDYSEALADAYTLGGDYRDALESYRQYTAIKDSVLLRQSQMLIRDASYSYR